MAKKWIWLFSLTLCLSLLGGCQDRLSPSLGRAVTQVEVTYRRPGQTLTRIYEKEEKMRAVLTYLRLLEPRGYAPVDPDTTRTDNSTIVVTLSDGSQRIYQQAGAEFLRKDHRPWQRVQGAHPRRLYLLVYAIETDK